jgi:acyl-ACP thioesterase
MANEAGATVLLERPSLHRAGARVFTTSVRVRLGDVDRRGRLRLDSTARLMQDIATDDAADAGLDRAFGWLVRRTMIDTTQAAVLGESLEIATWCTGIGRSWAERRTQMVGDRGGLIDAVSLWVQVDLATGRPARIAADFHNAYESTAAGRTISSRLVLDAPCERSITHLDWAVRRTDLDPFGHVNNAATWSFLEDTAALDDAFDRVGRAEMEYVRPVEHGPAGEVWSQATDASDRGGSALTNAWLLQDGAICAAARWTRSTTASDDESTGSRG